MLLAQNTAGAGGVLSPANHDCAIRTLLFYLAEVVDMSCRRITEALSRLNLIEIGLIEKFRKFGGYRICQGIDEPS